LGRVALSAIGSLLVTAGLLFLYVFASYASRRILKQSTDSSPFANQTEVLTAMLLAASVWIWWHWDRDMVLNRVARCVEERQDDMNSTRLGERVRLCYEDSLSAVDDLDWGE